MNSDPRRPRNREELLSGLMYYFRPGVLALFHAQSEKYRLETDDFFGHVEIRDSYHDPHENTNDESRLSVHFGFRACKNGEWAIAAFDPDLSKASDNERRIWMAHQLTEDELSDASDARFEKWVQRYIHGNWNIEDGPIAKLDHVIGQINAITECAVRRPLFTATNVRSLCFPSAENNHRYHDAHSEAYKYLQDSLSKDALEKLGAKLGIHLKAGDKKTVQALKELLPQSLHSEITDPLEVVSENRRLADHQQRPRVTTFNAFEAFSRDMEAVVRAMEKLCDELSERLNFDVASCARRAEAMRHLPSFDLTRQVRPNYGIFNAFQIKGKQVTAVWAGYQSAKPGRHDSEALVLEFSDGSLLGIDALTNIRQLIHEGDSITPEALHVTFDVTFVPPLKPRT